MARENVVKLFRDVQKNPDLKQKLNLATSMDIFVAKARELGYEFTLEEWRDTTAFKVEEYKCEISEIPGI